MTENEKNLNIFWNDLLDELISYWLDKLFQYYDAEENEFKAEELKAWVNELEEKARIGIINLHPVYFELIKSLDEPGYPPYDPRQDSPFESVLLCLHDNDRDKSYEMNSSMNAIFAEDPYEPVTILYKNAYVAFLNEFMDKYLAQNPGHTHIYLTNGSVGRRFKIP